MLELLVYHELYTRIQILLSWHIYHVYIRVLFHHNSIIVPSGHAKIILANSRSRSQKCIPN